MTLFQGGNGQGKSNLLEAVYILAVAKSPRTSSDREVVRWQAAGEEGYCQVVANVQRDHEPLKVQMDIQCLPLRREEMEDATARAEQGSWSISVQKHFRINGLPRLATDLVGELSAVMFSAQDIELVMGPPPGRRRYMDILISQLDRRYLRALQKYQRIIYQRNHLLRMVREGRAQENELPFWDEQLIAEGSYIVARRRQTVGHLSTLALPIYQELTGGAETLEVIYRPSVGVSEGDPETGIARSFQEALALQRRREIAQGVSRCGPHRDDLHLRIGDMDAGLYASRGQARTVALTLKLTEARYLAQQRRQEPVLLLDDVLSELDPARRAHVLSTAFSYQQCLLTTTDVNLLDSTSLSKVTKFRVETDRVEPMTA